MSTKTNDSFTARQSISRLSTNKRPLAFLQKWRRIVDLAILLMLLPVVFWAAILPERTLFPAIWLLGCLVLFYLARALARNSARLRWMVYGLLFGGLVLAITSPLSVNAWNPGVLPKSFLEGYQTTVYQATGLLTNFLVNPNDLSGALLLIFPLAMGLLVFNFRGSGWVHKLFYLTVVVSLGVVLVILRGQGAWAGLLGAVSLLLILRWRWWGLAAVLAGAGLAWAALHFHWSSVLEAFTVHEFWQDVNERRELWRRGIFIVQDFPFTGIGLGNYPEVVQRMYPVYERTASQHAHNLFLQIAVDLGLPGLLAWLVVFSGGIFFSWRDYRFGARSKDGWLKGLGAGLLASQLGLIVYGMVDAPYWGIYLGTALFWFTSGLTIGTADMLTLVLNSPG